MEATALPPPEAGDGWIRQDVLVALPRHAELSGHLSYLAPAPLPPGRLVRVPLGRRTVTGVAWPRLAAELDEARPGDEPGAGSAASAPDQGAASPQSELAGMARVPPPAPEGSLRRIDAVLDALPPFGPAWCDLLDFAARYYQRALGELVLAVLPPELRQLEPVQLERRLARLRRLWLPETLAPAPAKRRRQATAGAAALAAPPDGAAASAPVLPSATAAQPELPALSPEQAQVLAALEAEATRPDPAPCLLHGVTGSGKTEVYLRRVEATLAAGGQALLLVPEINLTPQFEARLRERFPARRIVTLHSGLTPAQRLQHWLLAHLGHADLVLGTRLAVFTSLPRLGLIVVDEEHDPSYKQQEGARYSARDLAVYRGRRERVPVLLGSATPSLESWWNAGGRPEDGNEGSLPRSGATAASPAPPPTSVREAARYRLLSMPSRIGDGVLPAVRLVDLARLKAQFGRQSLTDTLLVPPLIEALRARLAAGEQSLVLLNRRGYAPVLHCTSCGWKSACSACSAWRVFHKSDRSLRCHHCGFAEAVPRACPSCGDPDIQPMGRGTERIEEQLADLLPGARIGRIDADTTARAGSLAGQLAAAHAGEIDVLVGTQMLAKGHDFRRVTLVAVLNADSALYSADFRAPERLFALLMQAGGRAGRDAARADRSELWVPTWHPDHALYQALKRHDYLAFAASQLAERQSAGLPPYSHLALLRAEAREADAAMDFLEAAAAEAEALAAALGL
ncbi:MAG: hypothetical protein RL722_1443, partial [Pseudomonadota bacterium]